MIDNLAEMGIGADGTIVDLYLFVDALKNAGCIDD